MPRGKKPDTDRPDGVNTRDTYIRKTKPKPPLKESPPDIPAGTKPEKPIKRRTW